MNIRKYHLILKDDLGRCKKSELTNEDVDFYIKHINIINELIYLNFLSVNYKSIQKQFNEFCAKTNYDEIETYSIIFNSINAFYTNIEFWKKYLNKYKNNKNIFKNNKSILEIKDSELYDTSYEYMVVKALRNYAQHKGVPFTHISQNKLFLEIKVLLNDKKINQKAKQILMKHQKEIFIDLLPTINKAFLVLDELNDYIYKSIVGLINLDINLACEKLGNLIDENYIGGAIVWVNEELPDDDYYKVEYIDIPFYYIRYLKNNNLI